MLSIWTILKMCRLVKSEVHFTTIVVIAASESKTRKHKICSPIFELLRTLYGNFLDKISLNIANN